MRVRFLAIVSAFMCLASTAFAADRPDVKGLYLLADYPAVSVQPGTRLVAGPYVAETVPVSVENDYVVVEA